MKKGSTALGNITVCLLRSTIFIGESDRTLACVVSNSFMINQLLTSLSSCRNISWRRTVKLPHPPFFPGLAPFKDFLFPDPQKCPAWSVQDHPLDQPFSSVGFKKKKKLYSRQGSDGQKGFSDVFAVS